MDKMPSTNVVNAYALIYCRVSSKRQVKEGHGLDSQEKRCRDYAARNNLIVEKVFLEEAISGGLFDRPKMKEVIEYLDKHINKQYIIIFDDIKRIARDTLINFQIKSEIYGRGSRVASPNFTFEDSPEGKFVETVFAAQAELERNQNKRQVLQKMKARLECGYWPFCPPPGLKNIKDPIRGKVLHPKQPFASIYKEAIEKYRNRELLSQEEVMLFIRKKYKERHINRSISLTGTKNILTELLYTGYVEYLPWGISRRKGQHKGFISLETHEKVLEIINERSRPKLRKDYDLDFPLRPYVLCKHCGIPMTASWHKGRSKKYAHYWCKNKDCNYWSKTIRREKIETEFELFLAKIKLSKEILKLSRIIFMNMWKKSKQSFLDSKMRKKHEIEKIDSDIRNLLGKLVKTNNETVIKAYEDELTRLQNEKERLLSEKDIELFSEKDIGTAFDTVISVLENPITIWRNENIEWKRNIIFMYFEGNLAYDYNLGFGTNSLSLPVRLIGDFYSSQTKHVEMSGIEPESIRALKKII